MVADEKMKKAIGLWLKEARSRSGLSQGEVSETLGYKSPQFISNWERGLSLPPDHQLTEIVDVYNLKPIDLVDIYIIECRETLMRIMGLKR